MYTRRLALTHGNYSNVNHSKRLNNLKFVEIQMYIKIYQFVCKNHAWILMILKYKRKYKNCRDTCKCFLFYLHIKCISKSKVK